MAHQYAEYGTRDDWAEYTPTPAEIRREFLAIQQTWPPEETRRRAPWAYTSVELPVCTLDMDAVRPNDAPAASLSQGQHRGAGGVNSGEEIPPPGVTIRTGAWRSPGEVPQLRLASATLF